MCSQRRKESTLHQTRSALPLASASLIEVFSETKSDIREAVTVNKISHKVCKEDIMISEKLIYLHQLCTKVNHENTYSDVKNPVVIDPINRMMVRGMI